MPPAGEAQRSIPVRLLPAFFCVFLLSTSARATDEITVYNDEINSPRKWSLQLHANYVLSGHTTSDYPGGMVPDGALNGTPEFALGVTDFLEVGAYLPFGVTRDGSLRSGGAKLRTLFVSPGGNKRRFFYGVNVEVSYQPLLFSMNSWNVEIRPIVGWRWSAIELALNPVVEIPLNGPQRSAVFAPAARLAYSFSPAWDVALEHYSELGPIDGILPVEEQVQEIFLVGDYSRTGFDVDFGVGYGLTHASEEWTAKVILGWKF